MGHSVLWSGSQVGLSDLGDVFEPQASWHVEILAMTVAKPWNSCLELLWSLSL